MIFLLQKKTNRNAYFELNFKDFPSFQKKAL